MKLWPFSRNVSIKESAAGRVISAFMTGKPVWTERNYENFAREAYKQNSVGFRCVKLIAGSAAAVPFLLHDARGNEIETHPVLDLLSRPNPVNGGASLFEATYAYRLLSGNAYLEAVGPSLNKPPKELWTLRPDRMKVIAGDMGVPKGYEYEAHGQTMKWQADPIRGKSPILHLKEFDPINDWYGLSRVEPAAYGIDRHNAASAHNKALLDNGARPSGALVFEPVKTGDNTFQTAPEPVIKQAEEDLRGHTGAANAGRTFVLGGNVKWESFGVTPKDMDFGAGKDDAARDICLGFGVPHILVVPGQSTYNNIREAKLELYEDTILPMMDHVFDELNNWLMPMFGDGLKLSPDLDAISALEPRRESKRQSTLELKKEGVITRSEAREALQYGDDDPEAVEKIDAAVLKVLIEGIDQLGFIPLVRYAKSVGLYELGMTEEQIVEAATAHLGGVQDQIDAAQDTPAPADGAQQNTGGANAA